MTVTQENAQSKKLGNVSVLVPVGDVDMHESPKLRAILLAELGKKPGAVVIDLSGVSFIDSSGVATLVEGLKGAKSAGLSLILCGMISKVRDVFELARLDKVFTIALDRKSALE